MAFHLVQKMRNIRRLAVTVWSFLYSCASDNISSNRLIAAPMAGITDRPFRTLCYEMGAGSTVSEMMSSNPQVWESDKSRLRMVHIDEPGIRTVQISGSDPKEMADAARINVESGAQIIDINMGCPAKKVNRKLAGSALLQYPDVVKSILTEVVNAVDVPVTLKDRSLGTGTP
ncbi:tRNA-dihydrouridine synthase [Escherichia coli]